MKYKHIEKTFKFSDQIEIPDNAIAVHHVGISFSGLTFSWLEPTEKKITPHNLPNCNDILCQDCLKILKEKEQ